MRKPWLLTALFLWLLLLLLHAPAFPQAISFGVTAGVPITDPIGGERRFRSDAVTYGFPQYVIGPNVQIQLPLHLRLEVDALYRRLFVNYTLTSSTQGYILNNGLKLNSWEVPFLVEYSFFRGKSVHPFAGAGVAYRHFGVASFKQNYIFTPVGFPVPPLNDKYSVSNPHSVGAVFAAGLEFNLRFLHFSPQLRYSHWNESFAPLGTGTTPSNQLDVVLNINFSRER